MLHLSYPPYRTLAFHYLISLLLLSSSSFWSQILSPLLFSIFPLLSFLTLLPASFLVSLSVLPLFFLSFSLIVFIFSSYFSVRRCLQEVPCQWDPLSVPGSGPVGSLWPINSCLGECLQSPELVVLLPCSFDPVRLGAAGLPASSPNKPARSQPLLVEDVCVCVCELVSWLSSVSQHNKASGWDGPFSSHWLKRRLLYLASVLSGNTKFSCSSEMLR